MDVLREGLRTFRFHGRYYTDSFQHSYGHAARLYVADVIADSPADPAQYQRWLGALRVLCMFKERDAEDYVYEVSSGSELMRLGLGADWVDARAHPTGLPARLRGRTFGVHYMINLDSEVFTLDYCLHWKLSSIPRRRDEWLRAIVPSIYRDTWTISLGICPEELVTSPVLQLPEADPTIAFESRRVYPRVEVKEAWAVFLTHSLAVALNTLRFEIVNFGREWSPDSFLFRELMFALVSMASNRAVFHDSGARPLPRSPSQQDGDDLSLVHDIRQVDQTRLEDEWVGHDTPLEFGSMFHRSGKLPGASPAETIYWLEGVLVSLELVPDGKVVTKAVRWGIEQRHASFQAVILSLFEAAFVEVLEGHDGEIFVKVSDMVALSPIRAEWCMSTHRRERPPLTDGAVAQPHPGKMKLPADCVATPKKLQENFPGLAALVNFFDIAANRRAVV
ncbi:F-box domain-containingprotein [Purpureocillium lilacinum]|uniref:F-box domain-containingprotein n=1 Tax=Purpureocillium lilacinum TaxID=33203 RepID=A0A179G9P5_PURLI|nr:F-box domain-containingprotein [Purpureocillium lilacinum]